MSEKAITIYTPSDSDPHITADDDAFIYNSLLGGVSGILGDLSCQIDSGSVVLSGGGVSNRGYIMRIPDGDSVTLSVATGSQGMLRIDTVVSQFVKGGGTAADEHTFEIVTGTASTSPEEPTLTTSDLSNTGDVNQVALYYVVMYELEIYAVIRAAEVLGDSHDDSPEIYVQSSEPSSPSEGDIWLW